MLIIYAGNAATYASYIPQVCIDHMSSIHKGVPELQYQLGDCRDMHQFKEVIIM